MTSQVAMLRVPRQPSAVSRLVVSARVNTVDGQALWAWPHVGEERAKISAPSVAHRHALRAIEAVVACAMRVAAAFHAAPDGVFALVVSACDGGSVFGVATRPHGALRASARSRVAVQQELPHLDRALAAVALTAPERSRVVSRLTVDHEQLPESLAGQVFGGSQWHVPIMSRGATYV